MIKKLANDGSLNQLTVMDKINELIDVANQLLPRTATDIRTAGPNKFPEIIMGNPTEAEVQDQVRKQVGDDREIIGGGPDTGHFTGVR